MPPPSPDDPARSPFLVGPVYDIAFFIGAPLWAVLLGSIAGNWSAAGRPASFLGSSQSLAMALITWFSLGHLAIVFFRSHLNPAIFRLHPFRFTAVPLALVAGLLISPALFVVLGVLATWWNIWHTSLQTFGFCRLYDRRVGNDPAAGRLADLVLNVAVFVGPLLAGATLMEHVRSFRDFDKIGWTTLASLPGFVESIRPEFVVGVTAFTGAAILLSGAAQIRRVRRGGRVAWTKAALLVTTAGCSFWAWGLNPWGQAFLMTTFFHALQYFGIVWWSEGRKIASVLRVEGRPGGRLAALAVFLGAAAGYGWVAGFSPWRPHALQVVVLTVSLLHFWYDGFVWSVRKGQV